MFNNPFDSFHNTVAEAKEEREQLDRLLTVSTPRERLLVTVTALLLAAFVAWLFFGSVDRALAVDGVLVEVGQHPSAAGQSAQALVWIENDSLPAIEPGMPAVIELGTADPISGVVSAISADSLSELPAAFEPAAPVSVHRVVIALDKSRDPDSIVGRDCRVVIETGTQSPVAFLRLR
ncbi:MAG: hypothetical protein F4Y67_00180 [Chloroflexi bacterium]|nr:hypothetical protein [Chloroflexota bacterium]MYC46976.1 hypothetical protein [Chloroflexota bacterium]